MTKEIVKIAIEKLQEVAEYYEFPLSVFFSPLGYLKGKMKRELAYRSAYEKLCKIKEILEEDVNG